MNQLFILTIEFIIATAVFYLGFLIIKNYTTPNFKRFYLLTWMIFSVVFPLVSIETTYMPDLSVNNMVIASTSRPQPKVDLEEQNPFQEAIEAEIPQSVSVPKGEKVASMDWSYIIMIGYFIPVLFFLLRILLGVIQIVNLKKNAEKLEDDIFQVNNPSFRGASFFKWIFIGHGVDENRDLIIMHEKLHASLGHSFDILLSHIYCAIFWINPLSWILKKFIGLNTELQVDARMIQTETSANYARTLLSLSHTMNGAAIMNHFGAFHLKSRIIALTKTVRHRRWVTLFTTCTIAGLFFLVSCESVNSSEMMSERMSDVKTITTRFTSHQSDTQQKTGKIVAIASFAPDGSLEELIEQTTYPYDREYEQKKVFWEAPEKAGLPFVMDGLSLGDAEKSFLYGHDWPNAYYKHLSDRSQAGDFPWGEIVKTDNESLPGEIARIREDHPNEFVFGLPDVTEYFEYDDQKVVKVFSKSDYPELEYDEEKLKKLNIKFNKDISERQKEYREQIRAKSGKKTLTSSYTYDGDMLTSIIWGETERKFYYENGLMVKSEYIKSGEVINTRIHYYKNSLKDRTEIFNRYNEPEYTITYEYDFW